MSKSNVELARHGYEALKRGDVDAVAAMLDENVRWHWGDPMADGACRSRSEALAYMRRPQRRGPGDLVDVVDAGDRVVVITRGVTPEDDEPGALHAQITTFRDGKVIEMVGYPTVEAALAVAGSSVRPRPTRRASIQPSPAAAHSRQTRSRRPSG